MGMATAPISPPYLRYISQGPGHRASAARADHLRSRRFPHRRWPPMPKVSQSTYLCPPRYDSFEAFMPAVEEVWAATWARLQAGEPEVKPEVEEESPLSPTLS